MCCLVTTLLMLGPRLAIVIWWLYQPSRFSLAFQSWVLPPRFNLALPGWVPTLLGAIFVPWTTIAYLAVFPGGVVGLDWLWLGLGLLIDLGSFGGSYRQRDRIRRHKA